MRATIAQSRPQPQSRAMADIIVPPKAHPKHSVPRGTIVQKKVQNQSRAMAAITVLPAELPRKNVRPVSIARKKVQNQSRAMAAITVLRILWNQVRVPLAQPVPEEARMLTVP